MNLLRDCSGRESGSAERSKQEGSIVRGCPATDAQAMTVEGCGISVGLYDSLSPGISLTVMTCVTSLEKNFSSFCDFHSSMKISKRLRS